MKLSNAFSTRTFNLVSHDLVVTEGTSKGNQEKWKKDDYWIKRNFLGYEALSEVIASILMSCIKGFDYVNYERCKINYKGNLSDDVCFSRDFLNDSESLVTIGRLIKSTDIYFYNSLEDLPAFAKAKKVIEFVNRAIDFDITEYLGKSIYLDSLILNEDRHLFNLALIKTSTGYRECPVFDNGLSFLSDLFEYPVSRNITNNILDCKARPFSKEFPKQVNIFNSLGVCPLEIRTSSFYRKINKLVVSKSEEVYLERCLDVLDYTMNRLEGLSWIRY